MRFDTADHDPARTTAELRDFLASMHILFVDGYVLCDSGVELGPCRDAGPPKTITQLAMEQCEAPSPQPPSSPAPSDHHAW